MMRRDSTPIVLILLLGFLVGWLGQAACRSAKADRDCRWAGYPNGGIYQNGQVQCRGHYDQQSHEYHKNWQKLTPLEAQ